MFSRLNFTKLSKSKLGAVMAVSMCIPTLAGCGTLGEGITAATEYVNDATESAEAASLVSSVLTNITTDSATILDTEYTEPVLEESTSASSSSTSSADASSAEASQASEAQSTGDAAEVSLMASAENATKENSEQEKPKIMVFIGDSQFANGRSDGTTISDYMSDLIPNSVSYNLAIGGTAATLESSTSGYYINENWNSNCFVGIAAALEGSVPIDILQGNAVYDEIQQFSPSEVDYYFVEYGANDYINGAQLNNEDDRDDVHYYRQALDRGIGLLQAASPNAKIIICGPSYGVYYRPNGAYIGDSYTVSKGCGTLSEYANIASNSARDNGLYYFDSMYRTSFDLYLTTIDEYLIDGLHYTEKGRQIYATTLAQIPAYDMGLVSSQTAPFIQIDSFNYDPNYIVNLSEAEKNQLAQAD